MGLPATGAAVEGDAAVLGAAGTRAAAALLGRRRLYRRRWRVLVRQVRLRPRRLGAEEAELGPMLLAGARRAGGGPEGLPSDELRRRRGVVILIGSGRVAVALGRRGAPEDAELEHGPRRERGAGALLRRRGGRLDVQHRRLRRAGVAPRRLSHVQIQLHLPAAS
jgi:hypothetical protein